MYHAYLEENTLKEYICIDCCNHKILKDIVCSKGVKEKCFFCMKENIAIKFNDVDFAVAIKSLIKYTYDSAIYIRDFEVSNLIYDLLVLDNFIFNIRPNETPNANEKSYIRELYKNALTKIVSNENAKSVNFLLDIKSIPNNKFKYQHIKPVSDRSDSYLDFLKKELIEKNYYTFFEDLRKKVFSMNSKLNEEPYSPNSLHLYRARMGYDKIEENLEPFTFLASSNGFEQFASSESKINYIPYKKDKIGSPPISHAKEGRMNRDGLSFLYLAQDDYTAIAEMRPSIGHIISLGMFENIEDIKILDFTKFDYSMFYHNDEEINNFVFLNNISKVFSLPSPDKSYKLTQLISEVVMSLGYDGIKYKSSLSKNGINYVCFYPEKFKYVEDSCEYIKLREIEYHF